MGNLQDAIGKAADLAKLSDYSVTNYPTRVSIYQALKESGIFQMLDRELKLRHRDPAEQIKDLLLSEFGPNQWLYRCPYSLD